MRSAVILAGGKGLRMQTDIPKQFLELNGKPVLMRTLEQFSNAFDGEIQIVLVLPKDHLEYWKTLCSKHRFGLRHTIAMGGATRCDSVKSGLSKCEGVRVIGIHDGVRPLITETLIRKCYSEALNHGTALPVTAITQSLRKSTDEGNQPVDRTGMMAVQTPQCFGYTVIKEAYELASNTNFTDDATVAEAAGHNIHLVEGDATNIKITTKADLKIAEAILGMLAS
jgi:2-C-methyl-D-erythritol 4-phosphate cytidylyltransferase